MKMVKSLLLGTAAGLVALTGAQAADLPVKAKPVQYVKICSLYGAGFFYIPGTDTCIKIGGFVRAEMNFNSGGSFSQLQNVNFDDRHRDFETTRVRFAITVDARTQTEYGTLRAYLLHAQQVTNEDGGSESGLDANPGNWTNAGFIQFAGFTAGLTTSFFDFDTFAYSNQTNVLGSSIGGAGIPLFAYTAQFGNGFSASISAEDTSARRLQTGTVAGILAPTAAEDGYAGREWPDFVGNLRVDQAWGSAQIMGAVHQVRANYYSAVTDAHPSDEVGWAAGAGLKLNLPMIGAKDYVIAQFTYSQGALNYVGNGLNTYSIREGFPGVTSVAYGPAYDAVYPTDGSLDLTKAWSVTAGLEHWWVPNWRTSLYGAYAEIHYSDAASGQIAARNAGSTNAPFAVAAGSSADWQLAQIGSRTVWTVVPNLDLSVEVMYNHINGAFRDNTGYDDKGWVSGMFRVQRNFYP